MLKKTRLEKHQIPVVICSSLADDGAQSTFGALEYGAVEIITKPRMGTEQFLEDSRIEICNAVKSAAAARLRSLKPSHMVEPELNADCILSPATHAMVETTGHGPNGGRIFSFRHSVRGLQAPRPSHVGIIY